MTTTKDIHPIFQACCAEVIGHLKIITPFVTNGWLYATDGRIIVRTPSTDPNTEGRLPDAGGVYYYGEFDKEPTPIPSVNYPTEKVVCPECDGVLGIERKCKECGGNREIDCRECDRAMDCPECYGTGTVEGCGKCEGDGLVWPTPEPIEVAPDYGLSNRYLALLLQHGAKLYLPMGLNHRPAKFTVGADIEGRLMPMTLAKAIA